MSLRRRWRTRPRAVRVATFNVHVGRAVVALAWLVARFPGIHIVCVQEAQRADARRDVRRVLSARRWLEVSSDTAMVGTMIFARTPRFQLVKPSIAPLSRGVSGVHPVRELVAAALFDTLTRRVFDVASVHTWAMAGGLAKARRKIRNGHVRQVRAIAAHHAAQPDDHVQIAAGDFNENLSADPPKKYADVSARTLMGRAGLVPTSRLARRGDTELHYDEVFTKPAPHVHVRSRRVIRPPHRQADHPAVLVTFDITPLRK